MYAPTSVPLWGCDEIRYNVYTPDTQIIQDTKHNSRGNIIGQKASSRFYRRISFIHNVLHNYVLISKKIIANFSKIYKQKPMVLPKYKCVPSLALYKILLYYFSYS